jgi:excisionase family DNA binding protein
MYGLPAVTDNRHCLEEICMENDEVLNTQEAAELLGAHVETIRRMARRGTIPAYKIGKDWRFRKRALLTWSETNPTIKKPLGILVIDDDTSVCRLIQRMLTPLGYRVVTAQNGREGLDHLQTTSIDLILLDLEMPIMNGPAFICELKKIRPDCPVIVVTGNPDGHLMLEASRYRPLLLIAKPFDKKMLLSAVELALEGSSADNGP